MKRYILMILSGIALHQRNSSHGKPLRTQPQGAKVVIRERGEGTEEINISPALTHIRCDRSYTVTIKLGVFKTMIEVCRKYLEKGVVKNLVGAALDFLGIVQAVVVRIRLQRVGADLRFLVVG